MDELIYNGFSVLELSKLKMYKIYYDKLQPYFGQKCLQLHYIDCDCFLLSIRTQNKTDDLKALEYLFDLSNRDENHELFSNKNKKTVEKYKVETAKNIWIDEFNFLGSKVYSFIGNDKNTKKLKGILKSYSKKFKFEKYKKCLDGEKYQQECDNHLLRSVNHEMYLQKVKKSTFFFDDEMNFLNITKSLPRN